ncbi:cytochrome P450 [Paraburkholderia hospita]|uniref:Cytochrome P450 n=2 Tax=Paraburkholderia hospita TaxID=169430 RepID=A0AAN1JET0_9BURK|nr:cytochrome P450 [Paraburkholderia hospita]AUT72405.1 cytochrome P450 [Paraburkholderia hospita]OUL70713.1 cytochrome P450 [Paraburkholderia hospita]OUL75572.1 cytochrome P450 [Paraburkholderia hospita]OUL94993.1 cytochrome P450 [Paraburkholderia hospita]SEI01302.1 Cytochrome P450 [Paraburkholderia hospita]
MTDDTSQQRCPLESDTFPWPRAAECPLHPPPRYASVRESEPIRRVKTWDGSSVWVVTRMKDFREVLTSPHFSASPETHGYPSVSPARAAQSRSYQTFITMDPPEHGQYRRTLTKEFMMKRIDELRPFVQSTLDALLDQMIAKGAPSDFIQDVALPLPSVVISIMLGVPYEDHARLQMLSSNRMNLDISPELLTQSAQEMEQYIDRLLREKEQHPGEGNDLLCRLAVEWINTGKLSHADAVQMGALLYLAGHETTANQIGLGLLSLLQDSQQTAALIAEPSLVRGAVEEMLRFHSITHMNSARVATADVMIGGQLIRKGEGVFAPVQAANHDPEAFPEPDRFDIRRDTRSASHVAFSFGVHQCLGQPLARLELQVVFETLFKRLPSLRLAVPFDELEFKRNGNVFGLIALPVEW